MNPQEQRDVVSLILGFFAGIAFTLFMAVIIKILP